MVQQTGLDLKLGYTLLERFWRISLYLTDDAITKLYVKKRQKKHLTLWKKYVIYDTFLI